jgi:hypothetical protein
MDLDEIGERVEIGVLSFGAPRDGGQPVNNRQRLIQMRVIADRKQGGRRARARDILAPPRDAVRLTSDGSSFATLTRMGE